MEKLYLVTRRDLPPGAQAAQCCHAFRAFIEEFPSLEGNWFKGSNTLCLLSVENEETLKRLIFLVEERGIKYSVFREPDLGDALTALAIAPQGKGVVRSLPLALSG